MALDIVDGLGAAKTLKTTLDGTDLVTHHILDASEVHVGEVGFNIKTVQVEFSRPADTTAYAAKDVISNATSSPAAKILTSIARISGGGGEIIKARIRTNNNGITPRLRVHLFNSAPTQIADNSPFTSLYANRASHIGFIDFPAMSQEGTGSDCSDTLIDTISHAFKTSGSANLWFEIETLDAFTPNSAQSFFLELSVINH